MPPRCRSESVVAAAPARRAPTPSSASSIAPWPRSPRRSANCWPRSPSSSTTGRPTSSSIDNDLDPEDVLYGLYEGVPRTEWAADSAVVANRITLFRIPLEEDFPDPRDLAEEVRITVIHELAHHLGIDDDRLDELGIG